MVSAKGTLMGMKSFFWKPDVAGQVLAQIPKLGIGLVSTELGNKLINGLIGAVGNIINEKKLGGKPLLRSLFTNMMVTIADPTSNQLREISRNWKDLVGGMKAHSFNTTFGALFEEPHEVVGAIKGVMPSLRGFKGFKLSGFADKFMSSDKMIKSLDTSAVTTYSGNYASRLDKDDIVTY